MMRPAQRSQVLKLVTALVADLDDVVSVPVGGGVCSKEASGIASYR
jgi:hypothetical protein